MPQFDLRYINIAKYNNAAGAVSYTDKTTVGDAMAVDLAMKYAEGRLYAEGSLAEYMRKATGGTISIGTKYIPDAAQIILYGAAEKSRTVGSKQITGLQHRSADAASYVGVAFYAPDMVDGMQKYTCVFVTRALFGLPGMSYKTMGDSISFATPTTTGEFLPDNSADRAMLEVATCDTVEDAKAWCDLVLGGDGEG